MRLLALFLALATALQAAVPLKDPRITGTNSQVASGTLAVKSGATLAVEAGAFFTLAASLPLSMGGTGATLADPGADRLLFWDDSAGAVDWLTLGTGLSTTGTTLNISAAPVSATYITQTADATLTNEQALSGLATGLVQVTTSTGVLSSVTTSAGIAGLVGDETGTGALVFGTSPTIATPTISGAITLPAGVRQAFAPNATTPGLNVGAVAGDPSTPSNGDLWYNSTDNQLTARINGSNVDLGAGGTVATDAIWDAKGDLAVGTGSNTAARLAVGTNGQVLVADSAEATGVKWATVSGTGDVVGPASSTDARLALFDSTTGKLLKQSTALTESGGTITSNTAIGLTAGGTNQNVTLTPSGTGQVRATNRLYVGEGSAAFSGYQSLILAREGNSYGGALGIHHGDNPTDNFAWTFQRARGTLASPSAVQSGDRLGQLTFTGHDGSAYGNAVALVSDTTQNWTGSAHGANLQFATTANGSTSRTTRMIVDQDGKVYIGDSTSAGYLSGSSGGLALTAQGTNQSVVLTPSGTGVNVLAGGWRSGTASSTAALGLGQIYGDGSSTAALSVRRADNSAGAGGLRFSKARGSIGSPSAPNSADNLGMIVAGGYTGSAWEENQALLFFRASQNWSSGARGTQFVVATTPNGGTAYTENLTLDHGGQLFLRGTPSTSAFSGLGGITTFGASDADTFNMFYRSSADAYGAQAIGMKSRGTTASPSATQSGDILFQLAGGGYGSTAWRTGTARVVFYSTQNWTDSAVGSRVVISTTPNDSVTRADRVIVDQDGTVIIGDAAPASAFVDSTQRLIQPRASSSNTIAVLTASATSTDRGILQSLRSRGTLASPSAVQSGDYLWSLRAGGYDGATMQQGIEIAAIVDGTVSSGVVPQRLEFQTTSTTGGSRAVALTIKGDGTVQANKTFYAAADVTADKTITAGGTTGAQTINKNAGSVNFAAAATSLVVTNSRVSTSSVIIATVATNDSTMKSVAVVAGSGSFTIYANAAATAETRVNFLVVN